MSTKKDALRKADKAVSISRLHGREIGSLLTAIAAVPPTTPEAAKATYDTLVQTKLGAEESGAPPTSIEFYNGVLDSLAAFIEAGEI